jgi:hypothetical protein
MKPFILGVVLLTAGAFQPSARAMFVRPNLVPVERLVAFAEKQAAAQPSDVDAHYRLARVHYLAFIFKLGQVPAYPTGRDGAFAPADDHMVGLPLEMAREQRALELAREEFQLSQEGQIPKGEMAQQKFWQTVTQQRDKLAREAWQPPLVPREKLIEHLSEAVASFQKAMKLDLKNGLFALGLGSAYEQFADWNDTEKIADLPESLRGNLREAARAQYLLAWKLAYPTDAKARSLPIEGLSGLVSHEAGRAFIRLAEAGKNALSTEEKSLLSKVRAGVEKLEKLPTGGVTPMVFSLTPRKALDEHLQPAAAVEFDLTGLGLHSRWSWIQPDLALLVWDPLDRRTITSGQQLFGNYTWQIFWPTGYDALRVLDENEDGELSGTELHGLSAWFDRNGDGRSTRDEVTPLLQLGVRKFAVVATAHDGLYPMNPHGVTLSDDRTVPSWDWVAKPAMLQSSRDREAGQ